MWEIFIFSFLIALTGALTPGPVLTFTIYKSLKGEKGYLAGFWIILGHATLEFCLIFVLLLGAYLFFQNTVILILIGIGGGIVLSIFGIVTIRSTLKKPIELDFQNINEDDIKGYKGNSFLGGIVMSISNPYWIFWWAAVGLSLMLNFNISFDNPIGFLMFFLGHELGDFIFYIPVSIIVYKGGKLVNPKVYKYVLIACGLFMIFFGIFLATNIILFPPV